MFVSLIFEVELGLVGVLSFWPAILMIRLLCLISQFPTLSIQSFIKNKTISLTYRLISILYLFFICFVGKVIRKFYGLGLVEFLYSELTITV